MDKFCKFCGVEHTAAEYPKTCEACTQTTWINPTPVAVLLQPVVDGDRRGIIIGERGIEPQKGNWGLPGGFIDPNDADVIAAARREFWEETGIEATPADLMQLYWSFSNRRQLLLFVIARCAMDIKMLDGFVPNYECPSIRVSWEPEELCFESHTAAMAKYFRGLEIAKTRTFE